MSKSIGIIYNKDTEDARLFAKKVQECFKKFNVNAITFTTDCFCKDIFFAVAIGGDGTILRTARFYSDFDIPMLGINLGHLGFLSQCNPADTDKIVSDIINQNYTIQERLMLFEENTKIKALNDIVIKSEDFGRTSKFKLFVNNNFLCEYLADGIIISTPTGSSAYNLSAGGPVINPKLDAFVITAICPHTLGARPLVIPAEETISVSICAKNTQFNVIADGQIKKTLAGSEPVLIKKHSQKAQLAIIKNENNNFYSILRNKLYWGKAPSC